MQYTCISLCTLARISNVTTGLGRVKYYWCISLTSTLIGNHPFYTVQKCNSKFNKLKLEWWYFTGRHSGEIKQTSNKICITSTRYSGLEIKADTACLNLMPMVECNVARWSELYLHAELSTPATRKRTPMYVVGSWLAAQGMVTPIFTQSLSYARMTIGQHLGFRNQQISKTNAVGEQLWFSRTPKLKISVSLVFLLLKNLFFFATIKHKMIVEPFYLVLSLICDKIPSLVKEQHQIDYRCRVNAAAYNQCNMKRRRQTVHSHYTHKPCYHLLNSPLLQEHVGIRVGGAYFMRMIQASNCLLTAAVGGPNLTMRAE